MRKICMSPLLGMAYDSTKMVKVENPYVTVAEQIAKQEAERAEWIADVKKNNRRNKRRRRHMKGW